MMILTSVIVTALLVSVASGFQTQQRFSLFMKRMNARTVANERFQKVLSLKLSVRTVDGGESEGKAGRFMNTDSEEDDDDDDDDDSSLFEKDEDGVVDDDDDDDDDALDSLFSENLADAVDHSAESTAGILSKGIDESSSLQSLESDDPLTSNYPTVDVQAPPLPFKTWYLLVGDIDPEMRSKRSQYWTHHLQWLRRSALLEHINDEDYLEEHLRQPALRSLESLNQDALVSPSARQRWEVVRGDLPAGAGAKVAVRWEYTTLSEDCMSPTAQVVGVRADSVADVREYLQHEPLASVGAINKWKIYELHIAEPLQDDDISLSSDLHDPYLMLLMRGSVDAAEFDAVLRESEAYHRKIGGRARELRTREPEDELIFYPRSDSENEDIMYETDQNGVKYSLLYGQSSRVVTLAQLFDAEDRGAADEEHRAPAGQMLVFNARSRADALRYLSRDPATGTVPELFSASAKKSKKMFAVLSAINEQDVDGLYHVIGRNFATHYQLNQLHFSDPEDIFLPNLSHTEDGDEGTDLPSIKGLPTHFEMNEIVLNSIQKNGISFRYSRFNLQEQLNAKWARDSGDQTDKFSQFNTGMGIFQRKRAKPDILNFVDSLGSVENRSNPMESPLNDDN